MDKERLFWQEDNSLENGVTGLAFEGSVASCSKLLAKSNFPSRRAEAAKSVETLDNLTGLTNLGGLDAEIVLMGDDCLPGLPRGGLIQACSILPLFLVSVPEFCLFLFTPHSLG